MYIICLLEGSYDKQNNNLDQGIIQLFDVGTGKQKRARSIIRHGKNLLNDYCCGYFFAWLEELKELYFT